MEQIEVGPPPLPPKTRKSPPESTVLSSDIFGAPEVHPGQSQISGNHVVKIRINPDEGVNNSDRVCDNLTPCIRISVNSAMPETTPQPTYFFYNPFNIQTVMSSGQISPSDTLDSGTCSDLDSTPPPLPKKKSSPGVSVTVINPQHKRVSSLTDSDDNESNISCDSLNSGDLPEEECKASAFLPQGLLQDIRDRSAKLTQPESGGQGGGTTNKAVVDECTYEERNNKQNLQSPSYETDKFYKFHLNEGDDDAVRIINKNGNERNDETFAGYKDILGGDGSSTIRSAKGTIRGVKNRVRAGIATFLQINDPSKSYKERDAGKVVVYTTTMGIVRETHLSCMKVKQILRTNMVKFEERDIFMNSEYQAEIRERMRSEHVLVPQVFVDGHHIGDAEIMERLNESGDLRNILKPYKSLDACTTCQACGGFGVFPCPICNGSKKSVHRNHFTTEFVALKCMNCDEVGLIKCTACSL